MDIKCIRSVCGFDSIALPCLVTDLVSDCFWPISACHKGQKIGQKRSSAG